MKLIEFVSKLEKKELTKEEIFAVLKNGSQLV